jgi:predicted ATPase
MNQEHFTSVRFHHFKAFRDYSLALGHFNILVGPNNSGKSTIIGAFRILAEGVRKAKARNPELVQGPRGTTRGYAIDLKDLPIHKIRRNLELDDEHGYDSDIFYNFGPRITEFITKYRRLLDRLAKV